MKNSENCEQVDLDGFERVCPIKNLSEQNGKRFVVSDVEIAVFLVNGKVYALNNICPHQHTALIYDGFIENGYVVCPAHGWMFNLETGKMPSNRNGLDSYPALIFNENVYVKIEKKELKW